MKSDAAARASVSGGRWLLFSALGTLIALAGLGVIVARPSTASSLATLDVLEQSVEVRSAEQSGFSEARSGDSLTEGSVIRTDRTGLAAISYEDGSLTRIGPVSTYELTTLATHKDRREIVGRLDAGQTFHRVTKATGSGSRFEVQTSNAVAAVRGTAFAVQCLTRDLCEVGVTEGVVAVRTPDGEEVAVEAGQKVAVDSDGNLGDLQLLLESDPWIERNADIDNVDDGLGADPGRDGAEPQRIELTTDEDEAADSSTAPAPRSSGSNERQPQQQTAPASGPASTTTSVAQDDLDFSHKPQPHPDRIDGSEDAPPSSAPPTTSTTAEREESTTTTSSRPPTTTSSSTTSTTGAPTTTSTTRTQSPPQGTTSTTSEMEANDPPPATTSTTSASTTTSTAAETTTSTSTTTSSSTTSSSTTSSSTTSSSTTSSSTTSTTRPCPGNQVPDGQGGCRPECPNGGPPPCGQGASTKQGGDQPRWVSLSGSSWTSG